MATEGVGLADEAVGGAQVSTSVQQFSISCCVCDVKKHFLTIVCALNWYGHSGRICSGISAALFAAVVASA